jgi:hypothetical protein
MAAICSEAREIRLQEIVVLYCAIQRERASGTGESSGPIGLVERNLGQFVECVQSINFLGS